MLSPLRAAFQGTSEERVKAGGGLSSVNHWVRACVCVCVTVWMRMPALCHGVIVLSKSQVQSQIPPRWLKWTSCSAAVPPPPRVSVRSVYAKWRKHQKISPVNVENSCRGVGLEQAAAMCCGHCFIHSFDLAWSCQPDVRTRHSFRAFTPFFQRHGTCSCSRGQSAMLKCRQQTFWRGLKWLFTVFSPTCDVSRGPRNISSFLNNWSSWELWKIHNSTNQIIGEVVSISPGQEIRPFNILNAHREEPMLNVTHFSVMMAAITQVAAWCVPSVSPHKTASYSYCGS